MTKTSLKKLTSVVLAVLMLLSVFAVSASAADTGKTGTGAQTVYFDPGASSADSPAWFAWTWGGVTDTWVTGVPEGSYIRFDGVGTGMAIVRMKTGSTEGAWSGENFWNQSVDIDVTDNLVTFKDWGSDKFNVTVSHYGSVTPSSDTEYTGEYITITLNDTLGWSYANIYYWGGSAPATWPGPAMSGSGGTFTASIPADSVNVIFSCGEEQTVDVALNGNTSFTTLSEQEENSNGKMCYTVTTGGGNTDPSSSQTTPSSSQTTPPSQQTLPTASTAPIVTEPSSISAPTDPAAEDEDTKFYVSAKSNVNTTGSKVKVEGNNVQVSYTLTAPEKLDDGQVTVSYDSSKLTLSPVYNTASSMFPVVTDASYNLNVGTGIIAFNFSGINGKYDFTSGAVLVNLVFTKKSESTVGTATVYLNVSELASKNKYYVEDDKVAADAGITVGQTVAATTPQIPSETDASTSAENNITVNAKSNLTATAQTAQVTKSHAKVTFNLTAAELISYGDATVTFDNTKLALESRYNTLETMFTTLSSGVSYRLNVSDGVMKFNFTGVSTEQKGIYNFTGGGEVISLVFTVRAGAKGTADVNLTFDELGSIATAYVSNSAVAAEGATVAVSAEGQEATKSSTDPTSAPIATGEDTTGTNPTAPSSDSTPTTPSSDSTPTTPSSDSTPTTPSSDSTPTTPSSDSTPTTPSSDSTPTTPSSDSTPTTPSSDTTPTSAPKTTFTLKADKTKIYVGATTIVRVTNLKNDKGDTKFATANKKIATVTSMGVVKGVAKGSVIISAKNNGVVKKVKITVIQKKNPMTVKGKTITVKVKKKKATFKTTTFKKAKVFTVKKAKGKVTFKKTKGDKKITVTSAGKVSVKKGLKKGKTYTVTVKVTAKGTKVYKKLTKTVKFKVKITK